MTLKKLSKAPDEEASGSEKRQRAEMGPSRGFCSLFCYGFPKSFGFRLRVSGSGHAVKLYIKVGGLYVVFSGIVLRLWALRTQTAGFQALAYSDFQGS